MATELEKLQRRGQRIQDTLDRATLRREEDLRALLKKARAVDVGNLRIKQLLKRRERVKDAVGERLRAEKRSQRRTAGRERSPDPVGSKAIGPEPGAHLL